MKKTKERGTKENRQNFYFNAGASLLFITSFLWLASGSNTKFALTMFLSAALFFINAHQKSRG